MFLLVCIVSGVENRISFFVCVVIYTLRVQALNTKIIGLTKYYVVQMSKGFAPDNINSK